MITRSRYSFWFLDESRSDTVLQFLSELSKLEKKYDVHLEVDDQDGTLAVKHGAPAQDVSKNAVEVIDIHPVYSQYHADRQARKENADKLLCARPGFFDGC